MINKIKSLIAIVLSLVMCCSFSTNLYASEFSPGNEKGCDYKASFQVDKETLDSMVQIYNIPTEVAEYISGIFVENKNAEITVYSPDSVISTFGSSGSWSSTRTYGGYTLKDWNVHVTNSFNYTPVRTGSTSASFASTLAVYVAGSLADQVIPFGSAGITLIQFISGSGTTVYAKSGDKAEAAPTYTSDAKFTYVNIGGDYQLGARTYKAKLEYILWRYYSDSSHKNYQKTYNYNKTYTTSSYNNPDSKAISGVGIGGYLEGPISIKIGDKDFVLD